MRTEEHDEVGDVTSLELGASDGEVKLARADMGQVRVERSDELPGRR